MEDNVIYHCNHGNIDGDIDLSIKGKRTVFVGDEDNTSSVTFTKTNLRHFSIEKL